MRPGSYFKPIWQSARALHNRCRSGCRISRKSHTHQLDGATTAHRCGQACSIRAYTTQRRTSFLAPGDAPQRFALGQQGSSTVGQQQRQACVQRGVRPQCMQRLRQADAGGRLRFDSQVNGCQSGARPDAGKAARAARAGLKPGPPETLLRGATAPLWHTRTHLRVQVVRCSVVAIPERLVALRNKVCRRSGTDQQRGRG